MNIKKTWLLFIISCCFLGIILGAGMAEAKKSKKKKKVSVSFADDLVQGDRQKPELFYLLQQKQFNYKRLIRLRQNFLPEMRKTSREVDRVGSVD